MNTDAILAHLLIADLDDVRKIRLAADKRIKAANAETKVAHTVTYAPEAMQLTRLLYGAVKQRYPFTKEPKLEEWAADIDRLHRIDGYDWQLIQAVIRWSQFDDFWRQQIRSGGNLRKHFEKMLIKIKEERSKRGGVTI